jgi:hypothetical protein
MSGLATNVICQADRVHCCHKHSVCAFQFPLLSRYNVSQRAERAWEPGGQVPRACELLVWDVRRGLRAPWRRQVTDLGDLTLQGTGGGLVGAGGVTAL